VAGNREVGESQKSEEEDRAGAEDAAVALAATIPVAQV